MNNKRREHGCVDGWVNDRQREEGERREGSEECWCGAIVPGKRDEDKSGKKKGMREENGRRAAGLIALQWLQSKKKRKRKPENEGIDGKTTRNDSMCNNTKSAGLKRL